MTLRVVIVQQRTTRSEAINVEDIFSTFGSLSDHAANYFNAVFGPLQMGLARTCKVLSDKRYVLSYQRPAVNMRTNIKYLTNYYRDTASASSNTGSDSYSKGTIYVFYACYGQGLAENPATMNFSYKLAFIDN